MYNRNEVQPRATLRVIAPSQPSGEKVVAQAETGFQNREAGTAAPALGQAIAVQKNLAGLFERSRARLDRGAEQRVAEWVNGSEAELDQRRRDRFGFQARCSSQASNWGRTRARPL